MADPRSEPSMEDILASIKRIISDDRAELSEAAVPRPSQPALRASAPASPAPTRADAPPWPHRGDAPPADSVLELTDPVPGPLPPRAPATPPAPPAPVQRAVDRLRQAEEERVRAPRPVPPDLMPRTPPPRMAAGDMTLDALVREMLQPMLADWIERNLPDMVERLVQAEIRRMTDQGG